MVLSTINKVEQKYTISTVLTDVSAQYPIDLNNSLLTIDNNSSLLESLTANQSYELKLRISSSLVFWCGFFQVRFSIL